uniref:Uncharacterized protein n=1 Tax=Arundo donax TaxID=35708 RepID=A0A0A9BUY7_ARUDO
MHYYGSLLEYTLIMECFSNSQHVLYSG